MTIEEQIQNNLAVRKIIKLEINSNYSSTGTIIYMINILNIRRNMPYY